VPPLQISMTNTQSPLILSLETATLGGSIWLGRGVETLAAKNGDSRISQSISLLSDINACLEGAQVSLADIELFACAAGPGSFTGLRIGIATLKGLAATLERPAAAIPTLHAVAHAAGPGSPVVTLLPAGRGEVFAQMFSVSLVSEDKIVTPVDSPAHLSPERLFERYQNFPALRWAGSGAHLYREAIERTAVAHGITFRDSPPKAKDVTDTQGWEMAPEEMNLARHVGTLANQAFRRGDVQPAEALNAIYVRPSDAELKELHS